MTIEQLLVEDAKLHAEFKAACEEFKQISMKHKELARKISQLEEQRLRLWCAFQEDKPYEFPIEAKYEN